MIRILFVDDNEDVRDVCKLCLSTAFGAEVTVCSSGNKAIAHLKKNSFDVIISDYNMPDGSGLELLKYKLASEILIPFYFYTDELNPEIPYSSKSFIGIFGKGQFDQLCDSIKMAIKLKAIGG